MATPRFAAWCFLGLMAVSTAGLAEEPSPRAGRGPILVSPGGGDREGQVATSSPTFSWTKVAGAIGYDLVLYALGDQGAEVRTNEPAQQARLPAGTYSWTPDLRDELSPGRYAWRVGAILPGGREVRWAELATFRLAAATKAHPEVAQDAVPFPTPAVSAARQTVTGSAVADADPRPRAEEAYTPPPCGATGLFGDVPVGEPFCRWIEQTALDGISTGCAGGNYCPQDAVTREQMAMVLERAMRGTATWHPAQGSNVLAPPADNSAGPVIYDLIFGFEGNHSSITIGADGLPIISHLDNISNRLLAAHCNDVACAGDDETSTLVDPSAAPFGSSITIGANGLPVIAYPSATFELQVAHCNDVACAGQNETVTKLDTDVAALLPSIAIGSDGFPIVSYADNSNKALRVAHCNDASCSSKTITTVDDTTGFVDADALAIGADGLPVIAYTTSFAIKIAHCNDVACAGLDEMITPVDIPVGGNVVSITVGIDALPIISYQELGGPLAVAHCNDIACSGADETISNIAASVGDQMSITIGADGLPIISYEDVPALALAVAHCNDLACTGSNETLTVVDDDPANTVGEYSSITIGADGLPIIAYHDLTAHVLKVAHCANVFCTPFFRRR